MKKIFGTVLYLRAEKIVVVYIAGGDSDVHERRISGNPTGLKTMFLYRRTGLQLLQRRTGIVSGQDRSARKGRAHPENSCQQRTAFDTPVRDLRMQSGGLRREDQE